MPMDKAKRASWARALFGKGEEEENGAVLEGAGRMPSIHSNNNNTQARQLMQRQSMAEETKALKALDAALPEAQAAVWQETAPIPTGESWYGGPSDITKDLEEAWGKPTPTAMSQSSGQAPEAVAQPGDGWKGKQQTDAWVGGGGWSYVRINTQDGEIIQATNPKSGKVVEVKPGMKNADGMDLFQLIDVERQNQLAAGSTAPTDEMKRQAEAEIASVTPSKGDMEKAMNGGKVPTPYADARMAQGSAKAPKPKPVLGQEDMDYLFGSGAAATPALVRGEQALSEPDQLSSLAEPGTPEFKQAVAALSNEPLPAAPGTAPSKPGATGNVFQVDGKGVIVVGGGTDPLNPGLKAPLMVLDQQTGQAIPQNSPAYAKAIQMAGVK